MGLNPDLIPANVLKDLFERDLTTDDVSSLSAADAFEHYLEWNGIIGYARSITEALDGLRDADPEQAARKTFMVECLNRVLELGELNLDGQNLAKQMVKELTNG